MQEESDVQSVPRVLCILPQFPFDRARDVHGVFQRMRLFVDAMAALAAQVDLLFLVPPGADIATDSLRRHEEGLRTDWNPRINLILCPRSAGHPPVSVAGRVRAFLDGMISIHGQPAYASFGGDRQRAAVQACLRREPALIFAHNLRAMRALVASSTRLPPVLYDVNDIDHRLQFRNLLRSRMWSPERIRLSWLPALVLGELQAYRQARRVFVCSEGDERYLQRLGVRHAYTIPNAVEVPLEPQSSKASGRLLFLGSLDYRPNAEAAEYLISQIWPLIQRGEPKAELWIAGRAPEHVGGFNRPPPGVRFLGFVSDLDRLYGEIAVVVCPLLVGGGTRVKLVEAAALAKPMVSTTVGAEGLRFEDDAEILLRDEPRAFSEACVSLLRDSNRASRLGLGAWRKAVMHYSRPATIQRIEREARAAISSGVS